MKYSTFLIAAGLLCAIVLPANADLAIQGGTHNQRVMLRQTYWGFIPSRFRTSELVPVQLLTDAAMNKYINGGNDSVSDSKDADDTVDGIYEDGPPLITLRATRPDSELSYTVSHEYGHFVWQTMMQASEKASYNKIYNAQKSAGNLVSEYAGYNVNEGFAEAFATYSTTPALLKAKDPLSYNFINNLAVAPQHDVVMASVTVTPLSFRSGNKPL
jgi:hypothetical protein